jgi:hypothetical protein
MDREIIYYKNIKLKRDNESNKNKKIEINSDEINV